MLNTTELWGRCFPETTGNPPPGSPTTPDAVARNTFAHRILWERSLLTSMELTGFNRLSTSAKARALLLEEPASTLLAIGAGVTG